MLMRVMLVLLLVATVTGCGATHDKGFRACNGKRIVPATEVMTENGATVSVSFSVYVHSEPCGRVFERNALASIERSLDERVTGIRCFQMDVFPSCFARAESSGCLGVAILGGRPPQFDVGVLSPELVGIGGVFCRDGLP